ncbi:DoxX family protein [Paenibacillus sp. LHD-117]|uniref:DoxX family protein n=1 Tax=Paenibacillus sp. LHD-117 TaxID=3071412 RepID=UPI0027E07C1F|nr:DoxX family protein [Paenibacillus sp. LHD-117]MDQ6423543.1 DoxX family protein [Paenibacillus sp. LHD-117]
MKVDIVAIVLQTVLALAFLMAGLGKIAGAKMHVEGFKQWGLPQWFRIVTGIVEFASAAALIVGYWEPSWTAAGALAIAITAVGGVMVHLRAKDSFKQAMPIIVIGVLAVILFVM